MAMATARQMHMRGTAVIARAGALLLLLASAGMPGAEPNLPACTTFSGDAGASQPQIIYQNAYADGLQATGFEMCFAPSTFGAGSQQTQLTHVWLESSILLT